MTIQVYHTKLHIILILPLILPNSDQNQQLQVDTPDQDHNRFLPKNLSVVWTLYWIDIP